MAENEIQQPEPYISYAQLQTLDFLNEQHEKLKAVSPDSVETFRSSVGFSEKDFMVIEHLMKMTQESNQPGAMAEMENKFYELLEENPEFESKISAHRDVLVQGVLREKAKADQTVAESSIDLENQLIQNREILGKAFGVTNGSILNQQDFLSAVQQKIELSQDEQDALVSVYGSEYSELTIPAGFFAQPNMMIDDDYMNEISSMIGHLENVAEKMAAKIEASLMVSQTSSNIQQFLNARVSAQKIVSEADDLIAELQAPAPENAVNLNVNAGQPETEPAPALETEVAVPQMVSKNYEELAQAKVVAMQTLYSSSYDTIGDEYFEARESRVKNLFGVPKINRWLTTYSMRNDSYKGVLETEADYDLLALIKEKAEVSNRKTSVEKNWDEAYYSFNRQINDNTNELGLLAGIPKNKGKPYREKDFISAIESHLSTTLTASQLNTVLSLYSNAYSGEPNYFNSGMGSLATKIDEKDNVDLTWQSYTDFHNDAYHQMVQDVEELCAKANVSLEVKDLVFKTFSKQYNRHTKRSTYSVEGQEEERILNTEKAKLHADIDREIHHAALVSVGAFEGEKQSHWDQLVNYAKEKTTTLRENISAVSDVVKEKISGISFTNPLAGFSLRDQISKASHKLKATGKNLSEEMTAKNIWKKVRTPAIFLATSAALIGLVKLAGNVGRPQAMDNKDSLLTTKIVPADTARNIVTTPTKNTVQTDMAKTISAPVKTVVAEVAPQSVQPAQVKANIPEVKPGVIEVKPSEKLEVIENLPLPAMTVQKLATNIADAMIASEKSIALQKKLDSVNLAKADMLQPVTTDTLKKALPVSADTVKAVLPEPAKRDTTKGTISADTAGLNKQVPASQTVVSEFREAGRTVTPAKVDKKQLLNEKYKQKKAALNKNSWDYKYQDRSIDLDKESELLELRVQEGRFTKSQDIIDKRNRIKNKRADNEAQRTTDPAYLNHTHAQLVESSKGVDLVMSAMVQNKVDATTSEELPDLDGPSGRPPDDALPETVKHRSSAGFRSNMVSRRTSSRSSRAIGHIYS